MIHWQKISFLTKNFMSKRTLFFACLETHRHTPHWKTNSAVRFPGANGLCFPWSKKKKEKEKCMSELSSTPSHQEPSLPFPAKRFGKTLAEDNWFLLNSIQFLAAEFKPQPFSVLQSCWGEREKLRVRASWTKCASGEFQGLDVCFQEGGGGTSHCQTELSFTNPLTESSCSESWLAGL